MSLIRETRRICRQYNIKPARQRGQNFLINSKICDRVIEEAEVQKNDAILEIGAGLGALTKGLAQKAKRIIAVEIDKGLANILKKQLKNYQNVEIIQEDIRQLKIENWKLRNYKIVSNLPYNITGMVLKKFLSERMKPKLMVLILQKEVAQRICAKPPKMNLLAAAVQFYGQPKIISYISRNNFWPVPKVDSAILRITLTDTDKKYGLTRTDEHRFFEIVRAGFSAPRKYLLNNLVKKNIFNREEGQKIFQKLNFNLKVRAQELSVKGWIKLSYEITKSYKSTKPNFS